MDFRDSPSEAEYRAGVRVWLERNAPDFIPADGLSERQRHDLGRAWLARKAEAGYVGFTLSTTLGGRGGTIVEQIIFQAEEAAFAIPNFNSFTESWGVALPVIARYGTPAQLDRFAAATLRGEAVWCQMFSEPSGGSDLASLRTQAVRDQAGWRVNGQKVWTSDGHLADWGLLVARTNPALPKHKGLTTFLLNMKSPGVEIRPIRKISGDAEFNEVFLTDVFIPDDCRLGEINEGWSVVHTALHHEHSAFSGAASVVGSVFEPLVRLARRIPDAQGHPMLENAAFRACVADYYVTAKAVDYTRYRQYSDLSKGGELGFSSVMGKLRLGRLLQHMGAIGLDLAGPGGAVVDNDPDRRAVRDARLMGPGLRIGGGTDEIALNNISERVLGLPREIAIGKDKPFVGPGAHTPPPDARTG